MTSTTTVDRPTAPCVECGSADLIGPFEMDGMDNGAYRRRGMYWTVCRGCGRSAHVVPRCRPDDQYLDYTTEHGPGTVVGLRTGGGGTMSAFMVDPIHIDLMVNVALRGPRGRAINPGHTWNLRWCKVTDAELTEMDWREAHEQFRGVDASGVGYGGSEAMTPDELGLMLVAENLASIHARYPDTIGNNDALPGPIGVDWSAYTYSDPRYRLGAEEALQAIACYEYQSCEHDGWRSSEAYRFCDALRRALVATLPGVQAAPWGWSVETVAAARAVAS